MEHNPPHSVQACTSSRVGITYPKHCLWARTCGPPFLRHLGPPIYLEHLRKQPPPTSTSCKQGSARVVRSTS